MTKGIFSRALRTMLVLGHWVMGLPVMDQNTFTLQGSSFRMDSPNLKHGMVGIFSSKLGTSIGAPVFTSHTPPASE